MEASFSTQEPMAIGEGNPCGFGATNDDRVVIGGQRMEASFSTQEPKPIGEGNPCGFGATNDDRNWSVVSGWWLGLSTIECFKIPDQVGNDE